MAEAELILGNGPFGVRMTKEVMWSQLEIGSMQAGIDLENRTQVLSSFAGDMEEAMAAFLEKRPPRFGQAARSDGGAGPWVTRPGAPRSSRAADGGSGARSRSGSPHDGADVAISYRRDEESAVATVAEIEALGRRAAAFSASVDDVEQAAGLAGSVLDEFGVVDVFVHNAGIASRGQDVAHTDPEEIERALPHPRTRCVRALQAPRPPDAGARAG